MTESAPVIVRSNFNFGAQSYLASLALYSAWHNCDNAGKSDLRAIRALPLALLRRNVLNLAYEHMDADLCLCLAWISEPMISR